MNSRGTAIEHEDASGKRKIRIDFTLGVDWFDAYWRMDHVPKNNQHAYYYDHERDRYPPNSGWRSQYHGKDPAPKIQYLTRHPNYAELVPEDSNNGL